MSSHSTRRAFLAQTAAALALARASFGAPAPSRPAPQPLPFGSFTAGGDLAHRTAQNFTRLQAEIYRPPLLFRQANWKSWPGDFEGRALLAVTLLSRATGHRPPYFPGMLAAYAPQLNAGGYFGPALDLHAINEQQLSGHGWFLRGLCESYDDQRDDATLLRIRGVVRNLALPLRGKYAVYPIDPALRAAARAPANPGAVDGHLSGQHGDWAVSSDTGCAFIFLDGIVHAWVVLQAANDPLAAPLKELIDEVGARFLQIDLVAIQAQTHASLTAARALLRIYGQTAAQNPDRTLYNAAEQRYQLYRSTAMTAHYANMNWFGRPDSWTEPCAILDSFMVATQLWQHGGADSSAYLEDAHLIWFNGVGRGLRANGGFGTDTCPGFTSPWLRVRSYEAYFCCTMRGGEGHARAAQYLYFTQPDVLTVPFYSNSDATVDLGHGPIRLRQTTTYPYGGSVRIEVLSTPAPTSAFLVRLFAPSETFGHTVTLNGKSLNRGPIHEYPNGFVLAPMTAKPGDILQFDWKLRVGPAAHSPAALPGYTALQAGPLLLAPETPPSQLEPPEFSFPRNATLVPTSTPGTYTVAGTGGQPVALSPINTLNSTAAAPKDPCARQILFREA